MSGFLSIVFLHGIRDSMPTDTKLMSGRSKNTSEGLI